MSDLTLGSLFDGSGGFPLAGILCGITPIWSSEIEPFPIRVTEKRLPNVRHFGDISNLNGAELPPVDIITFGSPCQDMSVAGKRSGLCGERSGLFYEAIRVIKEMRGATNGKHPRYIVWENVLGAFSSNKGEDFRAVLEEICRIADNKVSIPGFEKWRGAGEIVGNGYSLAWRTLDAQFWGVPQRRRRIFLIADFRGQSVGKVLFESESLSGHFEKSKIARERTTGSAEKGFRATVCLNDQGGERIDITDDVTCTLRASAHHPPCVLNAAGFCMEHSANSRSIGYEKETSPTLRAGTVPAAVFENHSQDTRYTLLNEVAPTVSSTYGMGGNNQSLVVENVGNFDIRLTSEGTKNARANIYETDTSRTIDCSGNSPDRNQGGLAIVSYGIDRAAFNQGRNAQFDFTVDEEIQPTIVAKGAGAVVQPTFTSSKASFFTNYSEEVTGTLVATDYKDPPIVNDSELQYIVRRLTPTECARLQGFPDWWCENLGEDNPNEGEIAHWRQIFEEYRAAAGKPSKPKTDKQIIKWLRNPHSDSAEYKLWGNGVALPCVCFVLSGIVWYNSDKNLQKCLYTSDIDKST